MCARSHGSLGDRGRAHASRYVLYADGRFALQYLSPRFGFFEYAGSYTSAGGVITLAFDGWNTAGPWHATATPRGDSLSVRYNDVMSMADFEDGVYVRVPPAP